MRILIIGVSTRAIAESAINGGYPVVTLDYFGDRDQKTLVQNYALKRDFQVECSADNLFLAGQQLNQTAVVYISNLENYPHLVEKLAQNRILLGNTPTVLQQVRNWQQLRTVCQKKKISCPPTILPGEESRAVTANHWLRKPMRGGSGHGIQVWNRTPLDKEHFLQAFMAGQPASASFVANGQQSVVLGLSEQLIGQTELGTQGFIWGGNILPLTLPTPDTITFLRKVEAIATQLTQHFGLKGVNGFDFVVATAPDGTPYPVLIEVNPRYTASMELVEQAYGLNIFSIHMEAMTGKLPCFSLANRLQQQQNFWAKGIVFAKQPVTIPNTTDWATKNRKDIPFTGEKIEAGAPVCTLLVQADNRNACWARLQEKIKWVRQEIGDTTLQNKPLPN